MVAYKRPIELMVSCGLFLRQTNPNWDLRIMHDGKPPRQVEEIMNLFGDERIKFEYSKERNGFWGHINRKSMLEQLQCEDTDFVLMSNDDNILVPNFIEQMLGVFSDNVGMVFCDMLHNYANYEYKTTRMQVGFIDMGSFMTPTICWFLTQLNAFELLSTYFAFASANWLKMKMVQFWTYGN